MITELKRDPGVPKLQALQNRLDKSLAKRTDERVQKKKQDRRSSAEQNRQNKTLSNLLFLSSTSEELAAAATAFEERKSAEDEFDGAVANDDGEADQKRWYYRELKKVIDASDIIVEVLDARDPLGCRCFDVERLVLSKLQSDGSSTKRIVLVLNKIDLVPPSVVDQWLKYLRREFPTIAFKANTQKKVSAGSSGSLSSTSQKLLPTKMDRSEITSSQCVGGRALLELLKNYCRMVRKNGNTGGGGAAASELADGVGTGGPEPKKTITVGVIGYPNVGKSSLINSMKRARAVQTGARPGLTKSLQMVKLDKNITLIDSPGVIFSTVPPATTASDAPLIEKLMAHSQRQQSDDRELVLLRNCLRVEQLQDPIGAGLFSLNFSCLNLTDLLVGCCSWRYS